jgi:hypothetical protein
MLEVASAMLVKLASFQRLEAGEVGGWLIFEVFLYRTLLGTCDYSAQF